jgi:hypothetical protein
VRSRFACAPVREVIAVASVAANAGAVFEIVSSIVIPVASGKGRAP